MNRKATFIAPSLEYLASLEDWPKAELPMGEWIWSKDYTRSYFRHDFQIDTLGKRLVKAELEFQSDGPIDFYLNAARIETRMESGRYRIAPMDITSAVAEGVNKIGVCRFSSDNPLQFHVAMRGCIRLYFHDGTTEDVQTDKSWRIYHMTGFWESAETADWMVLDAPGKLKQVESSVLHPRLKRRGCLFRKAFICSKPVHSAVLTAGALGLYVPYLNGERVTEDRFIPGSMEQVTEYQVYDVTKYIRAGANLLAAETGSGWYNCASWGNLKADTPALMMELEIEYEDGTTERIVTDTTWQVQASPRLEDDIQYGERYDARLEPAGWNLPGELQEGNIMAKQDGKCLENYPEAFGQYAVISDTSRIKKLVKQSYPAVRIQGEEAALTMGTFSDGSVYYKFAYNSTGRAKLCLRNTKQGDVILIRYCEVLKEGNPYIETYGDVFYPEDTCENGRAPYGSRNLDVYICKGAEEESYFPEFAFTGFQYVYIKGYRGTCTFETVKKIEMNTDLREVGAFYCSDAGLNQIWDAVKRSYRSNVFTGPMDCPTREKNFWNGDIQIFASTACWYMDNKDFLSAWTKYGRKMERNVYGWEDEEYLLPLVLYRYYGDKQILADKYPVVQELMEKRKGQLEPGEFLPKDHAPYGDHQAVINVPRDFFAACYYCLMYKDMAEIAGILGKEEDAKTYWKEFEQLKIRFNDKYYLSEEKDYTPRCQSGIVLPMAFGLAPKDVLQELAEKLHQYVVEWDYHLTTGFMATEYVLNILCDYGYGDDAWEIMTNREYPSLINMLSTVEGGTTTESWAGYNLECGCSMNHYAIGGAAKYFFEQLGGIQIVKPGFDEVLLKPDFRKELKECCVRFRTRHGEIVLEWEYKEEQDCFFWKVIVPKAITVKYHVSENSKVKLCFSQEE